MEHSGSQSTRASTNVGVDNAIGNGRNEGRNRDHGRNVGEQPDPVVEDGRVGDTQHDGQSASSKQRSNDQDAPDDEKEQIVSCNLREQVSPEMIEAVMEAKGEVIPKPEPRD